MYNIPFETLIVSVSSAVIGYSLLVFLASMIAVRRVGLARILGVYVVSMTLPSILQYSVFAGEGIVPRWLVVVVNISPWFWGISLWYATRNILFGENFVISRKLYVLLILLVGCAALFYAFNTHLKLFVISGLVFTIYFQFITITDIRAYWKALGCQYSSIDAKQIVGLLALTLIQMIIVINDLVFTYDGFLDNSGQGSFNVAIPLFESFSVCCLGSYLLFSKFNEVTRPTDEKHVIDENVVKQVEKKINAIVDERLLFLDSELSLAELARECDLDKNIISEVLNHELSSSFYDFVNTKRIDYFIKQVDSGALQKSRISELMFDVGFGNKVTFNREFKKRTGMTPSQYKKSLA